MRLASAHDRGVLQQRTLTFGGAMAAAAALILAAAGPAQAVDLSWSATATTAADVFRDGTVIAEKTANDGAYTDNLDKKGAGAYTDTVCEAGTTTCSNEATVTF